MPGDKKLKKVGCVGRISSFNEAEDNRYLITLSGIARFEVDEELDVTTPYRQILANYENYKTDLSNFHKNVFFVEKFAEHNKARTIHCFSDDFVDFRTKGNEPLLLDKYTLRNCWPYWNSKSQRRVFSTPDLAKDGKHLGINHHKRFAEIFLEHFSMKLK